MTTRALFPTLIRESSLAEAPDFARLNDELERACLELAQEDGAGRAWSRDSAYPGYTSYASLDDLPVRDPAFGGLKRLLDREVAIFARELSLDLGRKPRLDSLWVNVLDPRGGHSGHIHPHSVISGTYYVSTPEGASALKFEDPRLPLMMARPTLTEQAPQDRRPFVYVQPRAGTVLLWESWLRHEVPANAAKRKRISISFNYR
ncbi:TIGR02466 family protein [Brevundimonas sp.]|uniref:TIGR02466 family protein n=1 Tax=Brevundimonas sp. TaxID=1871086 RepID=UPI0025D6AEC6|nr:TIGR02466 family protein [Brevundimonas sp.]